MSEILRVERVTKVYGNGILANDKVELSVKKGEIHAICGENGAGKSTLMKMLFGLEQPDDGEIYVKGQARKITSPSVAIGLGIGMVHQHFMLVDELTVAENVVLGYEPKKGLVIDWDKAADMTREVGQKYNLEVEPGLVVGDISVGLKQRVEIVKALLRGAEILILDEPTAVLTRRRPGSFLQSSSTCAMRATPFCSSPTSSARSRSCATASPSCARGARWAPTRWRICRRRTSHA